jgi:hypothetical protein
VPVDRKARAAVDAVIEHVGSSLATSGWRRRNLGMQFSLEETFTLDVGGGILATMEIQHDHSWSWGSTDVELPTYVVFDLGVGFEPALSLMPLLTLQPIAPLLHSPVAGARALHRKFEIVDERSAPDVAAQICAFVNEHATSFAAGFADADAIARRLEHAVDAGSDEPRQWRYERLLTVLLATGRTDDAAARLPGYRDQYATDSANRRARRFARQVARRIVDMPDPIPPVEETLAVLPPRPRRGERKRKSFAESRARSQIDRAVGDEVRKRAKGRTAAELRTMLAEAYAVRGVDRGPMTIAVQADLITVRQRPFGALTMTARALGIGAEVVGHVIDIFRERESAEGPSSRPPDRAAFDVPTGSIGDIAVEVNESARDWLDRVHAEALRIGPIAHPYVWLTRSRDADNRVVTVNIGERAVGTVPTTDAAPFEPYFRAGDLFDEDPVVRGLLLRTTDGVHVLEIPLPDPTKLAGRDVLSPPEDPPFEPDQNAEANADV